MREFIRPIAGAITPLALMGVRCFWPHNMIGRGALSRSGFDAAVRADEPSVFTSHPIAAFGSTRCSSSGHVLFLPCQHYPGDPRRLVGERDNRSIKSAPGNQRFQPLPIDDHRALTIG